MSGRLPIILAVVIVVSLMVLSSGWYQINMTEQAVVTRFGEPIRTVKEPGLKFKMPIVDKVTRFDKRILQWDGSPDQVPTKDKKFIWVDCYARWRIQDPLQFYKRMRTERGAQTRLDDIIDSIARNYISDNDLIEVVRNSNRELLKEGEDTVFGEIPKITRGRHAIANAIFKDALERLPEYGIELIDFRIKRINYVEEVRTRVYDRMISERKRIAEKYLAEGKKNREEVEGERLKLLNQIQSEAYQTSQAVRGEADAESTRIYAEAYKRDPDFYVLTKSLENYKTSFGADTTFILSTGSDFLKHLKRP